MPTITHTVPISDTIREILQGKLTRKEVTQTELAEIAETDQGSISRFMREKQNLSLRCLDNIAAHFNLTVTEEDGDE